jgi:ribosomal protein S19
LSLLIHEDMVGHKFGEFASTRKKAIHKKKTKKK